MIRHYFKTAFRTMFLNRTYSATNLVGLAVGLVAIMLISTLVSDELSYDKQWTHRDELYRLRTNHLDKDGNVTMTFDGAETGFAGAIAKQFPEIVDYTNISSRISKLTIDPVSNQYIDIDVIESDSNFFNLFDTQVLEGNPKQTYTHAKNLVITESTHKRFFNGRTVVGKQFYNTPYNGDPEPYIVTAIIKDLPQNTHLHTDALVLIPHQQLFEPGNAGGFQEQYLRIKKGVDLPAVESKMNIWFARQKLDKKQVDKLIELQRIEDIHLRTKTGWESPMRDIYILIGIGILILLLVCLNFINLTLAHAIKRMSETGVRKVLGANQRHLILQMGIESLLLFGGSLIIAFVIYTLALGPFEKHFGHPFTLTFQKSISMLSLLILIWLSTGIFCSLFPAIILAKIKAMESMKRNLYILKLPLKTRFIKSLIVLQFGIAMIVVICMLTVKAQLLYMDKKDLGYEPKNLLALDYTSWDGKGNAFKESLLQTTNIEAISFTHWTPFSGSVNFNSLKDPENEETSIPIVFVDTDFDFVKTLKIKIVKGRDLDPKFAQDAVVYDSTVLKNDIYANVLTNQSIYQKFDLKINEGATALKYTPVGVIQDFHAASLRYPMSFFVIRGQRDWDNGCMLIRAIEGKKKEVLAKVNAKWKEFFPGRVPRMNWLEDQVRNQYEKEQKQFQQLVFFSTIGVLIALLGVVAIAIYTLENKVKEIGIRKVLGASVTSIVTMVSSSFSKLVILASILAFPIAWWLMNNWLENFSYHIDIPIYLFVGTSIILCITTFSLVGMQAAKAARANPVDSLRDE